MRKTAAILLAAVGAAALPGCFTGIESTPRITDGDVRRRDAAAPSPEMLFLDGVGPERPADWRAGKRFYVADERVAMLFAYSDGRADSLAGTVLTYAKSEAKRS